MTVGPRNAASPCVQAFRKGNFVRAFSGLVCLLLASIAAAPPASARQRWYRGNTHAHTTNSDGDTAPLAVARWYKTSGYDFVFITDHDYLTGVADLNAALGGGGSFLVITGAEITDSFRELPVHVNSLNPRRLTPHMMGGSVVETMLRNVNAVRAAGGLPYVAHPSWRNAMTAEHLKALPDCSLFELFNSGVTTYNYGDGTRPSVEQMWDQVLSTGRLLYGVAADDMHSLTDHARALPGGGWVMVRAAALTPDEIVRAMARGDFYATNGASILDLKVTNAGMSITTEQFFPDCEETPDLCLPQHSLVEFIGRNGRVLKTTAESPAEYRFAGDELYVRARVSDPFGRTAWTQPVFLSGPAAAQTILNGAIPDRTAPRSRAVAPDTVAVVLGTGFATVTTEASPRPGGPFPLELNGTRVSVAGRPAPLFFASPTQVNFLVAPDTPEGVSDVVITNPHGLATSISLLVQPVAPALFTQDGTGGGEAVTYKLFRELPTIFKGDPRRVIVFATGVGRTGVTATANGQAVPVEAVVASPTVPGLTQIHLALPAHLGPGPVTVVIRAGAAESNSVTVRL